MKKSLLIKVIVAGILTIFLGVFLMIVSPIPELVLNSIRYISGLGLIGAGIYLLVIVRKHQRNNRIK